MTDHREDVAMEQVVQQPTDEVERLRKENEDLRRQLEETKQALKSTQDELATLKQNPDAQSRETPSIGEESVSEDVNVNRLYKFGDSSLEENDVRETLKGLRDPYKSEIRKFIKENQIKEMQDYLNNLIDENVIDKSELKKVCEEKNIWLYENGHILADGKFGPQTMETIKMLKKVQDGVQQEREQGDVEENDQLEEIPGLGDLKIEDLGIWNKDGKFVFKDGLIDEESQELVLEDNIRIAKIGEGGQGVGYLVKDGRLSIGNFENGLLDGKGVEFYPYGDENRDEGKDPNLYGTKFQGKWQNGELKDGIQIVKEDGLDVHFKVENGLAIKCYLDDESKSFVFENHGDGLYLKNGENILKLKNRYSASIIMKILYDYKNQNGEFLIDLSEGVKSKKLLRKSSNGETKLVYGYADNLVESSFQSEGSALAFWLNEARKPAEELAEQIAEE